MKLIDLNKTLADVNSELYRIAEQVAALPTWRRGSREHMRLADERQRLLRRREELRTKRHRLFRSN